MLKRGLLCILVAVFTSGFFGISIAITPRSGLWEGTTDQGYTVLFIVTPDGQYISEFLITVRVWHHGTQQASKELTRYFQNISITDDEFSVTTQDGGEYYGTFTSIDHAEGEWHDKALGPPVSSGGNLLLTGDGTWTASRPPVAIDDPIDGTVVSTSPVPISGTITDNSVTSAEINTVQIPLVNGHFSVLGLLAKGVNFFTLTAFDASGNIVGTYTIRVILDPDPPVIIITSPQDGSSVSSNELTVTGVIYDATPTTVEVNGFDGVVQTDGTFSADIILASGNNLVSVTATDAAGNKNTVSINVTLENATEIRLYLQNDGVLTELPGSGPRQTEQVFNNTLTWEIELDGDIIGEEYSYSLWARTLYYWTIFRVRFIHVSGDGTETVLASSNFDVEYASYERFEGTLTGIDPDAQSGDLLRFTISRADKAMGFIAYGSRDFDSFITIPRYAPMYTIDLGSEWNLVSTPFELSNNALSIVLGSIADSCISVWTYDTVSSKWKKYLTAGPDSSNDLVIMESGKSYWFQMSKPDTLILYIGEAAHDSIPLEEGYNMVGYNSLAVRSPEEAMSSVLEKCRVIWGYDSVARKWRRFFPSGPTFLNDLQTMEPGKGYIVEALSNGLWASYSEDASSTALTTTPLIIAESKKSHTSIYTQEAPHTILGSIEADVVKIKGSSSAPPR